MAQYELWLTDDVGRRLQLLDNVIELEAAWVENGIGALSVRVPESAFPWRPDMQLQLWRAPAGARLRLWRAYFLRAWRFNTDENGRQTTVLRGYDTNDILRRRIVAAYTGSATAEKTDYADDMLRQVVREALLNTATPTPDAGTRALSALTVEADTGSAPEITLAFAWKRLLELSGGGVLPAICAASRTAGTELYFDIEPDVVSGMALTLQLRARVNQLGRDLRGRVVFSQEEGSLSAPELEYDYSDEVNYVYAAGQGQETAREVAQIYDAARYGVSAWGRCEGAADARDQDSADAVEAAGQAALADGRPRRRFGAQLLDTPATRYGVDWERGDRVSALYRNTQFDGRVRLVTLRLEESGAERVMARLEADDANTGG